VTDTAFSRQQPVTFVVAGSAKALAQSCHAPESLSSRIGALRRVMVCRPLASRPMVGFLPLVHTA
jgi:hypothetical protein